MDNVEYEKDGELQDPGKSEEWLALIRLAEKKFQTWHDKAKNVEKLYADLERLNAVTRDRQFQMFWANVQVLGPSIYSRPPIPVVSSRFKDRKPLNKASSEVLERCAAVVVEDVDIDLVMRTCRDAMLVTGRAVPRVRLDEYEGSLKICVDYVEREDFLHDPARSWKEVDWVAYRAWMNRKDFKARFPRIDTTQLTFKKVSEDDDEKKVKIPVWEIHCKSQKSVVFVCEGHEKVLDKGRPDVELKGHFPSPRPAYTTCEARSLVPIPDVMFYMDQLSEINDLTARISALTDAVKVRGFYPGGGGEVADAIEAAIKIKSDNQILVPISNWQLLGGQTGKDLIVWLPIDQVVAAIQGLIELRKQVIRDVYEIMGLGDIMRGSSDPNETLGAQELKSQYGSVRIKDKQAELIRLARDLVRIICEMLAEKFSAKELKEMSQLDIPFRAEIMAQMQDIAQQKDVMLFELKKAEADPQVRAMAEQNPEQAQQVIQQAQQQLQQFDEQLRELQSTVTIDDVQEFISTEKLRAFALDIETDSTIAPDEIAQKKAATEYLGAMGGLLQQAIPALQMAPQAAPLISEMIRYANSQFRVGRQMETIVEEFTDNMKQVASQPKPNPEAEAAKIEAEKQSRKIQAEIDALKSRTDAEIQIKAQAETHAKDMHDRTLAANMQKHQFEMEKMGHEKTMRDKDGDLKQRDVDMKDQDLTQKRALHDMTLEQSKASHQQGMASESAKTGIPLGYDFQEDRALMKGLIQEIAVSREVTAKLADGQQEIADGMKAIATAQLLPVKITSPEGRIFIKEPVTANL